MTPLRLGLIHISQETNDFNPSPTTLADYEAFGVYEGEDVIAKAGATGQVAGHLRAVAESGLAVETVPIIRAHAVAGGRIDHATLCRGGASLHPPRGYDHLPGCHNAGPLGGNEGLPRQEAALP